MSTSFRLAWLPVVLTAKLSGYPSRAHRGNALTNPLQQLLNLAGSSWLFQGEYWFRGTSTNSARAYEDPSIVRYNRLFRPILPKRNGVSGVGIGGKECVDATGRRV